MVVLFKMCILIDWETFSKPTTISECLRRMEERHAGGVALRVWRQGIVWIPLWVLMSHRIMAEFAIGKKTVVSVKSSVKVRGCKWVENMDEKGCRDVWPMA